MAHPPKSKPSQPPATEENHPQIKPTIFIEEMMHLRPESDLLNWELLRFIERCCKQGGSVTEGGPDHHQFFVEMSDQEMQAVVRAIISGFRLATSRAVTINGLEGISCSMTMRYQCFSCQLEAPRVPK